MHPLIPFTSVNLVLLFHSVPSQNSLRSTLKTIKSIYKFIPIEEIESYYYKNKEYSKCCHICFDDGDRTFYENAFPVLKELSIPATLFVSPKAIRDESNYWFQELRYIRNQVDDVVIRETICDILGCNYAQIKRYGVFSIVMCTKLKNLVQIIDTLKEKHNIKINEKYNITEDELYEINDSSIITVGAHTMSHPILSNETDDNAEKEIRESVEELSKMLNRDIKYFAYPNGTAGLDYSTREQLMLQQNKIKLAFSTDIGFFNKKTNPLSIPRCGIFGLTRTSKARILGGLFLIPILRNMRNISPGTETRERKEIKDLSIF